ncbi:uncharacterized protein LOC110038240 [Phalaenopsis equestris]|uniref:uncharacterized protein LOC110038240 n=1 Tax=Phalaenopsis equestris TaxID=78828 RepID=UPI0009E360E0|nr:uncharacterized protein LOC110038240 [Phalaenopsis equestris]
MEYYTISKMNKRKFEFYEEVQGRFVNILEGLELYTRVFSESDERSILDCIFDFRDRAAVIILQMIDREICQGSLDMTSCIINIYDEDCIPPHIDHHDLLRPFFTVSFKGKSNILFGKEIDIVGSVEFRGVVEIPLLVGSVFVLKGVLKGNEADVTKHCIPGCDTAGCL